MKMEVLNLNLLGNNTRKEIVMIIINNQPYDIQREFNSLWYLWEVHRNYRVEIFHAKTKKACKEFLNKMKGDE